MNIDLRFVAPEYPALCVHINANVNENDIRSIFGVYGQIKHVKIVNHFNCQVIFIDYARWFRSHSIDEFRVKMMTKEEMKFLLPFVIGKDLLTYYRVAANYKKTRKLEEEEQRRRQYLEEEERRRQRRQEEEERRRQEEEERRRQKERYESKSIEQLRMEDRDIPEYELFAIDYGKIPIPNRCSKKLVVRS